MFDFEIELLTGFVVPAPQHYEKGQFYEKTDFFFDRKWPIFLSFGEFQRWFILPRSLL